MCLHCCHYGRVGAHGKIRKRADLDLNQGSADLQSAALTTELCTHVPLYHCARPIRVIYRPHHRTPATPRPTCPPTPPPPTVIAAGCAGGDMRWQLRAGPHRSKAHGAARERHLEGQCDRVVKVMDSKSIALCPHGVQIPSLSACLLHHLRASRLTFGAC